MTVKRMDNVGIVIEDIDAAIEFFTELGLERRHTSCNTRYALARASPEHPPGYIVDWSVRWASGSCALRAHAASLESVTRKRLRT